MPEERFSSGSGLASGIRPSYYPATITEFTFDAVFLRFLTCGLENCSSWLRANSYLMNHALNQMDLMYRESQNL